MQLHLRKSFCPEWKVPSFARHARTEIIQQQSVVLLDNWWAGFPLASEGSASEVNVQA